MFLFKILSRRSVGKFTFYILLTMDKFVANVIYIYRYIDIYRQILTVYR